MPASLPSSPNAGNLLAQEATRKALEFERVAQQARIRRHYATISFILFNRNRGMSEKRLVEIWGKDVVALAMELSKPRIGDGEGVNGHGDINGPVIGETSAERIERGMANRANSANANANSNISTLERTGRLSKMKQPANALPMPEDTHLRKRVNKSDKASKAA